MAEHIDVLDGGYVRIVDALGTDDMVADAARVSYASGTKKKRSNSRLIHYLMRNEHMSPFEVPCVVMEVKAPLFVIAQWFRHTMAKNQSSARYSEMDMGAYVPRADRMCQQSPENAQCSGAALPGGEADEAASRVVAAITASQEAYRSLLDLGVAREVARCVLPVATYSSFVCRMDLRHLFYFLRQRLDCHAQWEMAEYARAVARLVEPRFPVCYSAFKEHMLR